MEKKILVFGCDRKMLSCQKRLCELGFDAFCCTSDNFENIQNTSTVVLPLPTVANECISGVPFESFCSLLSEKHTVFCGNISADTFPCRAYSYYYDEGFLIKNSRLTAQGTLKVILENTEADLHSVKAAVIGYGRCGREICRNLKNNGADVTSFSRRSQSFAAAENDCMHSESIKRLNEKLGDFDITVNTVPCNIIDKKGLERLTDRNLYVEVASRPYGFNIAEADKYNFRYVLAESLPGRFTPVSAGINIADTVADLIKESEIYE